MGKLTMAEALDLQKRNILTGRQVEQLQAAGHVSTRPPRRLKRWMKTPEGNFVRPVLTFVGIKGSTYSSNMIRLEEEFIALLDRYITGGSPEPPEVEPTLAEEQAYDEEELGI